MRKRALSILLCAALALSLAACGGGQTGSSTTEPPAESTSSGQQTTEPESSQPEETELAKTKPTETESEETTPAETEPEETTPAETESEETKPAETQPTETEPEEWFTYTVTVPEEIKPDVSLPTEVEEWMEEWLVVTISGKGVLDQGALFTCTAGDSDTEELTYDVSAGEFLHSLMRSQYGILLVLEDGVTAIGNDAFSNKTLVSVTIPGSVTEIESYAFAHCTFLTSVTILNPDCEVAEDAFFGDIYATINR